MKQGRANTDSAAGQKREPIPHAVEVCAVSQLGNHVGNRQAVATNIYEGRGLTAPMAACTIHPKGSQK